MEVIPNSGIILSGSNIYLNRNISELKVDNNYRVGIFFKIELISSKISELPHFTLDVHEAELRQQEGTRGDQVIPLLLQNQPPVADGKEGDVMADVELRPKEVRVHFVAKSLFFFQKRPFTDLRFHLTEYH